MVTVVELNFAVGFLKCNLGEIVKAKRTVPHILFQLRVAEILTHTVTPITMMENTTPAVKQVKASKVAIMDPNVQPTESLLDG